MAHLHVAYYRLASTKELTGAQHLDLARTLHYDFRSSNGQIRRVLGLSQFEVESLFPEGKVMTTDN